MISPLCSVQVEVARLERWGGILQLSPAREANLALPVAGTMLTMLFPSRPAQAGVSDQLHICSFVIILL